VTLILNQTDVVKQESDKLFYWFIPNFKFNLVLNND